MGDASSIAELGGGGPIETPRLHHCARLEGKRSKEAGGRGEATKATCAEGARRRAEYSKATRWGQNLPNRSDLRNTAPQFRGY